MISCYWGSDREGSRRAARAEMAARREEFPLAPVFEFAGDNLIFAELRELASARPLLGDRVIIFFDHLAVNLTAINFITENLPVLATSDNIFIFWEDELVAGVTAKEFKIAAPAKSRNDFAAAAPLFAVADALGDRDRKRGWLLYHEARRGGAAAEEIFWKLVWKVKTLLLVATAPAGSVLPMKSYPLSQAKRQVREYKSGELTKLSSRLVRLYHEARRGRADFDFAVERLLLEL